MSRRLLYLIVFAMLLNLVALASAQESASEAKPAETEGTFAALEVRYQKLTEQLKEELPKREIKIQIVGAQKTRLFRVDPKLLENKFVAQFKLVRSAFVPESRRGFDSPDTSVVQAMRTLREAIGVQLKSLIERCPAEYRPDQRMIDFLTSDDCERDVRYSAMEGGLFAPTTLSFQVFATTAVEAEHRARAIIQLYDAGFCRPLQQSLLGEGQKLLEQIRSQHAELSQLGVAIRAEDEKLAKPSEISGDILSQLKAQKVMVAVELAGLNARVKACDAMLADPSKLPTSTLQSIGDLKVKAEIERVGIKEKLDQINIFIAEGDLRATSSTRRAELLSKQSKLTRFVLGNEQEAMQYAEFVALYAPFQIPDNQIAIGPIEWSQE